MSISDKHRRRWGRFESVGCVACRLDGFLNRCIQVHHLNIGGKAGQKRRGHDFTIPLCPWHHQGQDTGICLGPSLALESRKFRERYGSDDDLLAMTNSLLETLDQL